MSFQISYLLIADMKMKRGIAIFLFIGQSIFVLERSLATVGEDKTGKQKVKASKVKTSQKAKDEPNCTVDGHGPYNLKLTKCLKLGSDQAHTNCVLKEKEMSVEVQFSYAQKKTSATCVSKLKAGTDDCLVSQCYIGN